MLAVVGLALIMAVVQEAVVQGVVQMEHHLVLFRLPQLLIWVVAVEVQDIQELQPMVAQAVQA
jgi:hypothetical protein